MQSVPKEPAPAPCEAEEQLSVAIVKQMVL